MKAVVVSGVVSSSRASAIAIAMIAALSPENIQARPGGFPVSCSWLIPG